MTLCGAMRVAPAEAQDREPTTGEIAVAREAFVAGVRAAKAGKWDEAEESFRRSYDLYPRPRTLLNLAGAQSQTGHLVEAAEGLRQYLREAPDDADARAGAEEQLREVERRIPRVELRVAGMTEDDVLALDGAELSQAIVGTPMPVNPGEHRVKLTRGTRSLAERTFTISEGQTSTVELAAGVPDEPKLAEPPARATPIPTSPPPALDRDVSPKRAEPIPTPGAPTESAKTAPKDEGEGGGEGWKVWMGVLGGALVAGTVTGLAMALSNAKSRFTGGFAEVEVP